MIDITSIPEALTFEPEIITQVPNVKKSYWWVVILILIIAVAVGIYLYIQNEEADKNERQ